MTPRPTIAVIAKQPISGAVKTRLCPPLTQDQATAVAKLCLEDTFDAVRRCRAAQRVVVFEGESDHWIPDDFARLRQRGIGLGERLANAFLDVNEPMFIIGMDTPQVEPKDLESGLHQLAPGRVSIGPTQDGGYWGIGMYQPIAGAFEGVPMSTPETYRHQLAQLQRMGLAIGVLNELVDIDDHESLIVAMKKFPSMKVSQAAQQLGIS